MTYGEKGEIVVKQKLLIDMHCHILPNVDDGAKGLKMALDLILEERRQGVGAVIMTPHFRIPSVPNDTAQVGVRRPARTEYEAPLWTLKDRFDVVKQAAADLGVELYLGCEYYAHAEMADFLDRGFRPTLAGSRYVLVEFSKNTLEQAIREQTQELQQHGYIPVIAHTEHYAAMFENYDFIRELSSCGCKMQLNADSICGKEGLRIGRFCKKMVQYGLLDFVGSNAHDLSARAPHMKECFQKLCRWKSLEYATKIMVGNPEKILDDAKV